MFLRNRFLNSTSFLFNRPGEGDGGGNDGGEGTNGATQENAAEQNAAEDAGTDAGDEGAADSGDGDADADTGDDDGGDEGAAGSDEEDDEDDFGDLSPEQRARVEKRLNKETTWRDRQIDRLYRRNRESQEDLGAMETIAARRTAGGGAAPGATQQQQQPSTPEEVQAAAREIVARNEYDGACNAAFAKGNELYKDRWDKALNRLPKLGGLDRADMQNIVATDNPHVVLFELSKPEVYERVMALPPARRLNEFVKMSLKEVKPKAVESKRPGNSAAPVVPVTGRRQAARSVDLRDDKVSDDAWYAERNRTRRKQFSSAE